MQLARRYQEGRNFPVFVEPKIDGCRVMITLTRQGISFKSRQNNSWVWLRTRFARDLRNALKRTLAPFQTQLPISFDCELQSVECTWSATMSAILHHRPHKLILWVFDVLHLVGGEDKTPLFERRKLLEAILSAPPSHIKLVPAVVCHCEKELIEEHNKNLSKGFEGSMAKEVDSDYQCGRRTLKWLKLKPEMDVSGDIIDIDERGDLTVKLCDSDGGRIVRCCAGLTREERDFLRDGDVVELYHCVSDREQPYVLKRILCAPRMGLGPLRLQSQIQHLGA